MQRRIEMSKASVVHDRKLVWVESQQHAFLKHKAKQLGVDLQDFIRELIGPYMREGVNFDFVNTRLSRKVGGTPARRVNDQHLIVETSVSNAA